MPLESRVDDGSSVSRAGRLVVLLLMAPGAWAQGTVPTFRQTVGDTSFTIVGNAPAHATTTNIPTVLVPVTLAFEARKTAGKAFVMDPTADVPRILGSPVFSRFAFPSGAATQYADAMLRSTFPGADGWHTLLEKPVVKAVRVSVPAGYGYVLTSKSSGGSFAVLDVEFLQREIFKQVPKQEGRLVIAVTHNATYYAEGDATICCSWGTHGVDSATGNSFVLASYLHAAPGVVEDEDVQPVTQQLGEFVKDPLHDPLFHGRNVAVPGNIVPAWMRPGGAGSCGGTGVASNYFLLEPTNTNPKNNVPASKAFVARVNGANYHLQNVALPPWYVGAVEGLGAVYSFPDAQALTSRSLPCSARGARPAAPPRPTAAAMAASGSLNGHRLIGYWAGYGGAGSTFPLREVSPQWDVILVAFATPDRNAPEGTMQFRTPAGLDTDSFRADIAYLKSQGKKVMNPP